jgi:hypothetical protein
MMIKKRSGLERLVIFFTGKRKYRCRNCLHVFRAMDRRRSPRAEERAAPELLPSTPAGR